MGIALDDSFVRKAATQLHPTEQPHPENNCSPSSNGLCLGITEQKDAHDEHCC